VKAYETARNVSALHDAYDRLVGVRRQPISIPPSLETKLVQQGSSSGTYIAQRPRRGVNTLTPGQPPRQAPPPPLPIEVTHGDEPEDDVGDDVLVDIPLDDEEEPLPPLRQRTAPRADASSDVKSTEETQNSQQQQGVRLPRFPPNLLPFVLGGGTIITNALNPVREDPVVPRGPSAPGPSVPTVHPVPPTLPAPPIRTPSRPLPPPPIPPQQTAPPEQSPLVPPLVVVRETRVATTINTIPAFATGMAIGMTVSAVSALF